MNEQAFWRPCCQHHPGKSLKVLDGSCWWQRGLSWKEWVDVSVTWLQGCSLPSGCIQGGQPCDAEGRSWFKRPQNMWFHWLASVGPSRVSINIISRLFLQWRLHLIFSNLDSQPAFRLSVVNAWCFPSVNHVSYNKAIRGEPAVVMTFQLPYYASLDDT